MLRVDWSTEDGLSGSHELEPSGRFVVARRMALPEQQLVAVEKIAGSAYVFVRLPYVSDPAVVVTATAAYPVLHRGQRANGAIVEVRSPGSDPASPEPGQTWSLTSSGTVLDLRYPAFSLTATLTFDVPGPVADGTGTVQLGVETFEHDDTWLVAAIAVALSPEHGVVGHAELKRAFAAWRGIEEPSDGSFDRNVLRPALDRRAIELPGPRLNKIHYLVERCRRTGEFPPQVLADVRAHLPHS